MVRKDLLTPAEHQIMVYLWQIARSNPKFILVRSILDCFPEEKRPAYTTLATFVKILTNKKFIAIKKVGNLLTLKIKVTQDAYVKKIMKYHQEDFFNDDPVEVIKFMIESLNPSAEQKADIKAALE